MANEQHEWVTRKQAAHILGTSYNGMTDFRHADYHGLDVRIVGRRQRFRRVHYRRSQLELVARIRREVGLGVAQACRVATTYGPAFPNPTKTPRVKVWGNP